MTVMFSDADQCYMQHAISLAKKGLYSVNPNPAVGCLLVKDGVVLAEGWHQKAGQPHAERVALAHASQQGLDVSGCTAYVTLEPCSHYGRTPPCSEALIEASVSRVVIAMQDPNPLVAGQGIKQIRQAGIEVEVGLCEEEARALNSGFIKVMEKKLPFVRVKMASSLDGRTAMENGESKWITGAESRQEVHKLRALSGAVITGIGTVLADDPSLTVRLSQEVLTELNLDEETCQPLRVVLDSNLRMPLDAKMITVPGRTIIVTSKEAIEGNSGLVESLVARGLELVALTTQNDRLDIESVLRFLVEKESIHDVMVESGALLAGAFVKSGFVDELHCYIAPVLLGDMAKPMFVLPGLERMVDKLSFKIDSTALFGNDIRLVMTPLK